MEAALGRKLWHVDPLLTGIGRSAWFIGVLLIFIYAIFALTLYMVPPGTTVRVSEIG